MKLFITLLTMLIFSCSGDTGGKNTRILIKTTLGDIKVKLYNETPLHRDNFISLVNSGFYEGVKFHRVINGFMIQSGDAATKDDGSYHPEDTLNLYTIRAEFNNGLFHKKGALAAARLGNEVNPEMRSSGTQFYIVQGNVLTEPELNLAEQQIDKNIKQGNFIKLLSEVSDSVSKTGNSLSQTEILEIATMKLYKAGNNTGFYKIPDEQRKIYSTIGGTPRLDGTYTVFGEVIDGIEIVDNIASAETHVNDKPVKDIKILKMKILK